MSMPVTFVPSMLLEMSSFIERQSNVIEKELK